MKYYIEDFSILADTGPEPFENKEKFLESIKYNWEVAKEYGDEVDPLQEYIDAVENGEQVAINGFLFYNEKFNLEIFLDEIKNKRIRNLARLYASAPEELTPKEKKQLINSGVDLDYIDKLVMKGE